VEHDEQIEAGAEDAEDAEEAAELDAETQARRQLALAQIRQYPDPVLRLEAQEVEEFDADLRQLVERMTRLRQDARGVGLAATQVGILIVDRTTPEGRREALAVLRQAAAL
jgi:peptide deformylase